jgi:methylmalonyl-CoA carboxyltransferase large subunit
MERSIVIGLCALAAVMAMVAAIGFATQLVSLRENVQAQLDELRARLTPVPAPQAAPQQGVVPPVAEVAKPQGLSSETLAIIGAAVAAFLGKTARIRSARLLEHSEANAWAQQGRVYIQASHHLERVH